MARPRVDCPPGSIPVILAGAAALSGESTMPSRISRRDVSLGFAAFAGGAGLSPARAQDRTQDTIQSIYEAAKKEGKVTFYSSNDVKPNQESAKLFAQKFPASPWKPSRSSQARRSSAFLARRRRGGNPSMSWIPRFPTRLC